MIEFIFRSPENPNSHHTAILRTEASYPARYLHRNGFIAGRVLDFGIGHGADIRFLHNAGFDVSGYDPEYLPEIPQGQFDTILCTYVLNVLLPVEQSHVLMAVSELLAPYGRAFFTVRRDISRNGFRRHAIHRTQVYECNVRLPYPSILRVKHCEIYEYRPLVALEKTEHPNCPLCHPGGHLSLITESATTYAAYSHEIETARVLVVPKVHVSALGELSEHSLQALSLVSARVQSRLYPNFAPENWMFQRCEGSFEHAHFVMFPRTP